MWQTLVYVRGNNLCWCRYIQMEVDFFSFFIQIDSKFWLNFYQLTVSPVMTLEESKNPSINQSISYFKVLLINTHMHTRI